MRILFIHADRLEYEVREPAIKEPEQVDEKHRRMAVDEVLVCFTTVETRDEADPDGIAALAANPAGAAKPDSNARARCARSDR